MTQQKYKESLLSKDWQDIRNALINKRGYKCEKCGRARNIQVHHLGYENEWNFENEKDLMLLCKSCHNLAHQDIEFFELEQF